MNSWRYSDLALLLRRIGALYIILAICRVVFYLYNKDLVGTISSGEIPSLLEGSLRFDTVSILYFNALFIILALMPFRFRERRWWQGMMFWYYMAVNSVAVVLNMADAVYFHYAQKRLTAEEFFYAGNDNSGQLIGKFAGENWYLILAAAVLIWAMAHAYKRHAAPATPIKSNVVYFAVNTLILAGVAALTIGGIRGGFTRTTRPITLSNAAQYSPSPTKANLILSNPFCVLRTMGSPGVHYIKYYSPEELDTIFTPYHLPPRHPDTTFPSMKGRNVVVFILESFSAEHSALLNPDLYPDGKGFTPFLDSLMRNGYLLPDAYSNGRKSIEALPSVLSSIPSFKTPFVLMPQSLAPTRPLPLLLREEGYRTSFFCGSERGSMGFGAYATSAGVERIYGREDYQQARRAKDHDGYWGIWDEPFIDYVGEELSAAGQPFMSTVFTLSSHHPFVVPAQYADSLPAGKTKVHKGVAYTDMALRKFFQKYGDEEWFRNTVFVFCADHVSSESFAEKTKTPTGNTHIISFIYSPDGSLKGVHKGVSQQTDLMPTLLGLMHYDKPYFAFGRDLLNEPGRPHMAVNYLNQSFQAVTDSVVIFFDEQRITAAYTRTDTLQKHNISTSPTPVVEASERNLKAIIQQYYSHIEKKSYVLPEYLPRSVTDQ